jgi:hypothetical protein
LPDSSQSPFSQESPLIPLKTDERFFARNFALARESIDLESLNMNFLMDIRVWFQHEDIHTKLARHKITFPSKRFNGKSAAYSAALQLRRIIDGQELSR